MNDADVVAAGLRAVLALIMVMHGWNHLRGGGRIAGTAQWFGGLGLRPPMLHAWMSVVVELAAGTALLLGFLLPLAAAATIGVMTVAGVTAHRKNGFFVFQEGYEYVLLVAVVCAAVATMGAGRLSVDHALGIAGRLDGAVGAAVAGSGALGALAMLAACWRPGRAGATTAVPVAVAPVKEPARADEPR